MRILKELCATPTAPFVEQGVVEYVKTFVAQRPRLRLSRDAGGNLLLALRGAKPSLPRWVFTAHMDHPGLVSRRMLDARTVQCDFRGWVLAELLNGVKVRFFNGDREIPGRIIDAEKGEDAGRGPRAAAARVRVSQPVPPNCPGMFDLTPGRVIGKRFESRVCDDLAGAAAALEMLDQLHARPPRNTICVLLTRAEEEGFIGAMAAVRHGTLLRKTDRLVAIECSALQTYAPQGLGPIIRVGDRTSIFNSALTYFLTQQAEAIRKQDKKFIYQRALMPGGTCEATVYDVYGHHAASICVALGNYHNMDLKRRKISPEFIDTRDWKGMVKLFLAIARKGYAYDGTHGTLKARLEKRFRGLESLLR